MPGANPTAILLFEVYADPAAFAAHWNSPTLAQRRKEAGLKFVGKSGVPFQFADP